MQRAGSKSGRFRRWRQSGLRGASPIDRHVPEIVAHERCAFPMAGLQQEVRPIEDEGRIFGHDGLHSREYPRTMILFMFFIVPGGFDDESQSGVA